MWMGACRNVYLSRRGRFKKQKFKFQTNFVSSKRWKKLPSAIWNQF